MSTNSRVTFMATMSAIASLSAGVAAAAPGELDKLNRYDVRVVAKAQPDECYGGLTASYEPYAQGCSVGRVPKVNQAYIWGLAKTDKDLWMGTVANVNCLVEGSYLGATTPYETGSWACSFGSSGYRAHVSSMMTLPPALGDWRPSRIFRKPVRGGALVDAGATMDALGQQRLMGTLGLRSAGTHNGVVLLAGPALNQQALHLFAFDARSTKFLGSFALGGYKNIRKWLVAAGEMYTTVGRLDGTGAVLKWTGSVKAPFQFIEVGSLPSEGAELTEHDGRIHVATWPNISPARPTYAGVFSSNKLPKKGGLPGSMADFTKVWDVREYEPDPVVALTYGGGAIASFQGRLVWGTMHVPGVATLAHFSANSAHYATLSRDEQQFQQFVSALATQRAIAIFRRDGSSTALLYGSANLPAYDTLTHTWRIVSNNAGLVPLHGQSGFNNPFNNYTWTMAATKRSLFVGTMDFGYLVRSRLESLMPGGVSANAAQFEAWRARVMAMPELQAYLASNPGLLGAIEASAARSGPVTTGPTDDLLANGADLMRFDNLGSKAVAVSRAGVGNFFNYGVRTMIAADNRLYIGSANPMNLETAATDGRPDGGWELLQIQLGDKGH